MSGDAKWSININAEEGKAQARQAMLEAVQEVFELDIKPAAVADSPYLTGTNRRSIDTEVVATASGVQAQLFSQSGYGGYLELGTVKMKAQPYLFPAFNRFKDKIAGIIGRKIKAIKPSMFIGPSREGE
jgi:HK97 gp10 family phage protein